MIIFSFGVLVSWPQLQCQLKVSYLSPQVKLFLTFGYNLKKGTHKKAKHHMAKSMRTNREPGFKVLCSTITNGFNVRVSTYFWP